MIFEYRTNEYKVRIQAAREESARPVALDWCKKNSVSPGELFLYSIDGVRVRNLSARFRHEVPMHWEGDSETGCEVPAMGFEEYEDRQNEFGS